MNITYLCDDILGMIEERVRDNPKYKFKKVLDEIKNIEPDLYDTGLDELLDAPTFTHSYWYRPEDGGWWFESVNDLELCNENWIIKEWNDTRNEAYEFGGRHPITGQPLHQVQVQAF